MSQPRNALIIGASRGIGLGLSKRLQQQGWAVSATRRGLAGAEESPEIKWVTLDINNTQQSITFGQMLPPEQFDVIVVNAGVYGPEHQSVNTATVDELLSLFMTNTFSPIRIAEATLHALKANTGILAFTSSKLASLNENPQADMPLYSASKSALNMLTRALLPGMESRGQTLLSLHPGWVQTDLGGTSAPLTVADSVQGLVKVLESYKGKGGHHFVDYNMQGLSW
ncbi:SDR family oxidoreductase [Citrobacter sp. JGM124]|uniref:SDR family oxidoreductase n=1 Tax=Citrobacter sp. JGM124 TaxID=2799789 RepID=UPI001BA5CDD8|nr:SDR family oxidoreductase [Citrobacter sp. JGM124]MBS0849009.1 SDR family oxidoreductase [Citrobacter sp. JGM124]